MVPPRKKIKVANSILANAKGEDDRMSPQTNRVATSSFTRELPSLPFVDRYKNGKFYYVRKCYEEYYALVKKMLDEGEECATVTGTPGIGKSIFYAYFFQRFLEEANDDTWIIVAAYSGNNLKGTTVFKTKNWSEGENLIVRKEEAIDKVVGDAAEKKKKVVFLCDGTPKAILGHCQMVVFTSPDVKWLRLVRKSWCTFWMPLWTCEELREAASELGLMESSSPECLSHDVIETRFSTFGGVARECLSRTEDMVEEKEQELVDEIEQISDPGELDNLVRGVGNRIAYHRVLHYVPGAKSFRRKTTNLASPFVVQKLAERMLQSTKDSREKLCLSLAALGKIEVCQDCWASQLTIMK